MRTLLIAGLLALSLPALAHRLSDAELQLRREDERLVLELTAGLQDLAAVLPLDRDGDGRLRWSELQAAAPALEDYLRAGLLLQVDGAPCPLSLDDLRLSPHHGETGAWLLLRSPCGWPQSAASLDYRLLFEYDPSHRGVLVLADEEAGMASFVASPGKSRWDWHGSRPGWIDTLSSYLRAGMHHIWGGFDHLLFLAILLLPAALDRHGRARALGGALGRMGLIVTSFTVAHSLTLIAGVLGWLQPPASWIESAIAASVLLAALNNLFSWREHSNALVFAFGLLHGFGFAGALAEQGLPSQAMIPALVGFNLGVELGQLAVLLVAMPLLLLAARSRYYRPAVLHGGSAAACLLASLWLIERSLPAA